jgi:ADP-ribosylglycohydrolase
MACIAGAIAQAYYKDIPGYITENVYSLIPEEFQQTLVLFERKYL